MRKVDREIKSKEEIIDIIKRCDVIRLVFNNGDYLYILFLNFGFEINENKIIFYFYSVLEGIKVDIMKRDNCVLFEMDIKYKF